MIDDAGAVFRNDGFVMASTVVGPVVASMVGNGDNLVVAQVVVGSFWYYCVGAPSCWARFGCGRCSVVMEVTRDRDMDGWGWFGRSLQNSDWRNLNWWDFVVVVWWGDGRVAVLALVDKMVALMVWTRGNLVEVWRGGDLVNEAFGSRVADVLMSSKKENGGSKMKPRVRRTPMCFFFFFFLLVRYFLFLVLFASFSCFAFFLFLFLLWMWNMGIYRDWLGGVFWENW